jgi:transposase-like protein
MSQLIREALGTERRRVWSASEWLAMVPETYEPGMTVSLITRKHGVNPNQVVHCRKLEEIGALTARRRAAAFASQGVDAALIQTTEPAMVDDCTAVGMREPHSPREPRHD